jgi:hypothetical protein
MIVENDGRLQRSSDLMLIGCFQITNNVADNAGKQLKPSFLCIRGLWLAIHA